VRPVTDRMWRQRHAVSSRPLLNTIPNCCGRLKYIDEEKKLPSRPLYTERQFRRTTDSQRRRLRHCRQLCRA